MDYAVSCASLVAWLEGSLRLDFPETVHDLSLPNLERRVLALERKVGGITTPPPFEASSWNGMVWRLWRVRSRSARRFVAGHPDPVKENAGMLANEYTMAGLRSVVDSINVSLPELQCSREPEEDAETDENCQECISAMVQKLAYISGKDLQFFPHKALTKSLIYAHAANLIASQALPNAPAASTPSNRYVNQCQPCRCPPQTRLPNSRYPQGPYGYYGPQGYDYSAARNANDFGAPAMGYQTNAADNAAPGSTAPIFAAPASEVYEESDAAPALPIKTQKNTSWLKRLLFWRSS